MLKQGLLLACAVMLVSSCSKPPAPREEKAPAAAGKPLVARAFNSNFPLSRHTFNGLGAASDGKIYYVLCTAVIDKAAQMYSYDPATDKIEHVGDLNEAVGEKDLKAIPQGKSHVPFFESGGKLYFATHVGYYTVKGGRELMGVPPPGYKPYPGGHFVSYDLATKKFESLAKTEPEQGILAMTMDAQRGRLYGLTWPDGYFVRFDMKARELKNLGRVSAKGEAGFGAEYRTLCRALVNDPDDGSVYLTTADGDILRYRYDRDAIEKVAGDNLRKDYFGAYDPTSPGHMGYNWRQAVWHPTEKVIYAVHGNSGYLFKFDPRVERVDVIERITSKPSKQSGMFDKFYYGYLGFTLGPDNRTLYYLTGGCIYKDGRPQIARDKTKIEAQGEENLHLITWDIPTATYTDHGPIFFDNGKRPSYVNSIAIGKDGDVYALSAIEEGGQERTDLIRIPNPFRKQL
jgi:hypothetical protein